MADPRPSYPQSLESGMIAMVNPNMAAAMPYGVLEPGLKAAVDLLEREIRNESSVSELADARDDTAEAMTRAQNARAYRMAQALLKEQMVRLSKGVPVMWAGHTGEAG